MFRMHADLMGPARLQVELTQGKIPAEMRYRFKIGDGNLPLSVGQYRHFQSVGRMSADIGHNPTAIFFEITLKQRIIGSSASLFRYLPRQGNVRFVVFRNDQQSRRILVDTVYNPRA